jgi:hypothetical protein
MRQSRKRERALSPGQQWLLYRISDLMYESNAKTVLELPSMEQVRERTADHIASNPKDFPGPNSFDRALNALVSASLVSRLSDTAFVQDATDKVFILPQGLDVLSRDLDASQIDSLADRASAVSFGVMIGTAFGMFMTGEPGVVITAAVGTPLAGRLMVRNVRNSDQRVADDQARYRDQLGDGLPNVRELDGSAQLGEYRLRGRNGLTPNATAVLESLHKLWTRPSPVDSRTVIDDIQARYDALGRDPKAAPWQLYFGVTELEQIGAVTANRSEEGAIQNVTFTAAGLELAERTLGNRYGRAQLDTL